MALVSNSSVHVVAVVVVIGDQVAHERVQILRGVAGAVDYRRPVLNRHRAVPAAGPPRRRRRQRSRSSGCRGEVRLEIVILCRPRCRIRRKVRTSSMVTFCVAPESSLHFIHSGMSPSASV